MNPRSKAASGDCKALRSAQAACCTNRRRFLARLAALGLVALPLDPPTRKMLALALDGRVRLYGRVPNVDELKSILA